MIPIVFQGSWSMAIHKSIRVEYYVVDKYLFLQICLTRNLTKFNVRGVSNKVIATHRNYFKLVLHK